MGRQRLPEEEKKVNLTLSIKRKYIVKLKEKNVNISKLVEEFIEKWLKN